MIFYHVVSDKPKYAEQYFRVDEEHPNGVYERVQAQMSIVEDIYKNPEKYEGIELSHSVDVALREFASLGRLTYSVAKIEVNGRAFYSLL